jgi:hypothetical protein
MSHRELTKLPEAKECGSQGRLGEVFVERKDVGEDPQTTLAASVDKRGSRPRTRRPYEIVQVAIPILGFTNYQNASSRRKERVTAKGVAQRL